VAYRNRNTPDNRNNNSGFRVVCAHVHRPLFLAMHVDVRANMHGGAAARNSRCGAPEMQANYGLAAEVKAEEQRRMRLARVRQNAARQQGAVRTGRIHKAC
jgi:hypothetical protein